MLFYFIRHGESEANAAGVLAGWSDWNLTEKGREQARTVGEMMRGLPPMDKIYVSDLLRTRQTFEEAFGADTPHELSPLIREINTVPLMGMKASDLIKKHGESFRRHLHEMDYTVFGGEGPEHMEARVRKFMQTAAKGPEERVAVVCHSGVIRCAMAIVMGVPARNMDIHPGNCGVTVVRWQDQQWTLMQYNYTPEQI